MTGDNFIIVVRFLNELKEYIIKSDLFTVNVDITTTNHNSTIISEMESQYKRSQNKNTQIMKTIKSPHFLESSATSHNVDLNNILIEENGGHIMNNNHNDEHTYNDTYQYIHIMLERDSTIDVNECTKLKFTLFKGTNHDFPTNDMLFPLHKSLMGKFYIVKDFDLTSFQYISTQNMLIHSSIYEDKDDHSHTHHHRHLIIRKLMNTDDEDFQEHCMNSQTENEENERLVNEAIHSNVSGYGPSISLTTMPVEIGYYTIIGMINFNRTNLVPFSYGYEVEDNGDNDDNSSFEIKNRYYWIWMAFILCILNYN